MNPWASVKGLPRDMWVLFYTTLINRSGTMVIPFLVLYLTQKIGVSASEAGVGLLVYGIGAFISAPLTGRLADKIGALKVMKISLVGTSAVMLIYGFITNYYLILVFSFILSVINEAFRPANLSLISEIVTPAQRRISFALNRLGINIGMSIGPVVGGFLILIDYHFLFYVNAFASLAAGIYLIVTPWTSLSESESTIEEISSQTKLNASVLGDRKYLFFLFAIIPANLVFFQHLGGVPLYIVDELGYSTAAFGLLSAINTVIIIIAEVPLNNMMSNMSYARSMFIGALLAAIGFGAMAVARDITPLIITIIIWTFGEMIFFPVTAAYASEIAPAKKRGEYMGYFQMTFSFAFSAGPWLGTVVYEKYGSVILWSGALVMGLVTAVLILFVKEKQNESA
ncbi:MAG TPA: MFS transporter [Ignavibacteriaceae bacterium]|nr:MFS transporter [Ignavibacteriaceae bacterium]